MMTTTCRMGVAGLDSAGAEAAGREAEPHPNIEAASAEAVMKRMRDNVAFLPNVYSGGRRRVA
jgi:hypothetical protein